MATNKETLITVTGDATHDETAGLQNATATPAVPGDADDNDIASLSALPLAYYTRLFDPAQLNLSPPNGDPGEGQAVATVLTISNGAGLTDLKFTNAAGGALDGDSSGLFTTSGHEIFLFTDTNNNIVLGKYDSNGDTILDATAFALVLEETTANNIVTGGRIWIIQFTPLDHPDDTNPDDVIDLTDKLYVTGSQETLFSNFDDAPANQNAWTAVDNDGTSTTDIQLLITGLNLKTQAQSNDKYGDSVNTRATSLGSNNQGVDAGEALRFDFVTGITVPLSNSAADFTQSIAYGDHVEISGAGVQIVQTTPPGPQGVRVQIYDVQADTAQGNTYVNGLEVYDDANNDRVGIASVEIRNAAGQTLEWRAVDGTLLGGTNTSIEFTFGTSSDGTGAEMNQVDLTNLFVGYQILVRSATGELFDRMVVANNGTGTFDLGGIRILDAFTDTDEVGSRVNFEDDGPTITAAASTDSVKHDETPGQQDSDLVGTETAFGGATVADLFTSVPNAGDDPHVTDNPIGYAKSSGALVDVTGGSAGADGPAAEELSYALSVVDETYSGVETTEGTRIFMYNGPGGLILGRVGNEVSGGDTPDADGDVAFALAADPDTGEVYVAQYLTLRHLDTTSKDETITLASGAVQMSVTRTDGDGDKATDAGNNVGLLIKFDDDGPSDFTPADITAADNVQNQPGESATKDLTSDAATSVAANHSGSDGLHSIAFGGGTDGDLLQGSIGSGSVQNLTSGGNAIYLFGFGTDTLVATTDNVDPADQTDWVFTIGLDDTTDSYTFNMLGQIDNGAESLFINFAGQKQTIYEWLTLDAPGTDDGDVDSNGDGQITGTEADGDFLFTGVVRSSLTGGFISGVPGVNGEINVSSTGIGVESQSINPLEGVFIDFVDGAFRTLNGQLPISALDFDEHVTVNNAGFGISQLKPNDATVTDVRVSVYNESAGDPADSGAEIINDTPLEITAITVRTVDAEGDVVDSHTFVRSDGTDFTSSDVIDGRTITVDFEPNTEPSTANHNLSDFVEIDNLGEQYQVLIETASGFERILVENSDPPLPNGHLSNEGFDISGIIVEQFDAGDPVNMNFDLVLLDGDLDPSAGSFDVALTPPDQII